MIRTESVTVKTSAFYTGVEDRVSDCKDISIFTLVLRTESV